MTANNAYRLCLGLFKQSQSGSSYSALPDLDALIKWDAASIIPKDYEFTNFQAGDMTIEAIERNTITQMSKARSYYSGAITPPTYTFATMAPADTSSIFSNLAALTVDDPYKVLFCAGIYKSETSSVRTYDVFTATTALLTTDGGRTAEAKQTFTGSLALQACNIPVMGVIACGATMTWNLSTGAVALVIGNGGDNGGDNGGNDED